MPGPMRGPRGANQEKAKDFKGTMGKLLNKYMAKYKWQLAELYST